MNFDELIETWKSQDDKPIYGVNHDLLHLALRQEQDSIRRSLLLENWTTYIVGTAMTALTGGVLWWFFHRGGSNQHMLVAAAGIAAFLLWIGALWVSRRRQNQREQKFGSTLKEEVRRSLSLTEYQLSQAGQWSTVLLWCAPIIFGSIITFGLIMEINDNTSLWFEAGFATFMIVSILWGTYDSSREARRKLLPQRQRLAQLFEMLDAQ